MNGLDYTDDQDYDSEYQGHNDPDDAHRGEDPYRPDQEVARENLAEAEEDLADAELWRDRPSQRLHLLSSSWQAYDDAKSRLEDVVSQARQGGMAWDAIGDAIGMSEEDATDQFGHVDRS